MLYARWRKTDLYAMIHKHLRKIPSNMNVPAGEAANLASHQAWAAVAVDSMVEGVHIIHRALALRDKLTLNPLH